jgi:hypothetical protein
MLLIALVLLLANPFLDGGHPGAQTELRDLTAAEMKSVVETANAVLHDRGLWHGKTYLTRTEVVLDNRSHPPARYALLTFYRYEGDVAILATICLDNLTVTRVAEHPHMPTSLAPEEITSAETLAREHPEIKKALARYKHLDKIEVDMIAAQIVDPGVPGYQHRVARLFFRDGQRNYLPRVPMVDVDLTNGDVRCDVIGPKHGNSP